MPKPLIIVESPAKAKTIAGILGDGYTVTSSVGHIRDLPRKAADIPAKYKGEKWARLGVDVDNDFEPLYIVTKEKKETVKNLKAMLADASELYLATDEDREGESIAWHLTEVLKPKIPVRRMVFHEITPGAIQEAIENPRDVDAHLVDAQETRRVLDRLYGYEVSPVLWKKIKPKLSAGRVQSVATRIIVERERERIAFRSASYWDLSGTFQAAEEAFTATLVAVDGTRLATGKDFSALGELKKQDVVTFDEATAAGLVEALDGATMTVRSVEAKPYSRKPSALPDVDTPAGGGTQAPVPCRPHDVGGPAPLRERLHHLYADRLHFPVGDRVESRPGPDQHDVRRGLSAQEAALVRQEGEGRPGSPRGDSARG